MGMGEKKVRTVLFCFHNTDIYSGATRSLIDIIEKLRQRDDIRVVVMFPYEDGTAVDYFRNTDVPILFCYYRELAYLINQSKIKKIALFPMRLFRYQKMKCIAKRQKSVLQDMQVEVVYTNTSTIFIGAFLNKFCGIPHIWHMREFRKEDHQTDFFFGTKPFFRMANEYTDKIIMISNCMKEKHAIGINREKMVVIYNDISPDFINPKMVYKAEGQLNLLIAGSITAGKGQLEAIKGTELALKQGCDIALHIVGKTVGPYYERLVEYCKSHALTDKVIFHGFVKEMTKLRSNMDIGIVASRQEAFGRVTIEGMLSGLVIIGADSAGTSELIENNTNGLLYTLGDSEDLANKIILLYKNRSEMQRIAKNGFDYALSFTVGNCSDKVYECIQNVVDN